MAYGPYKVVCDCRKPNPGMLIQAAARWNFDLTSSFLIGDHESDMEAAIAVGVRPFLINGGSFIKTPSATPVSNLLQAADIILNETIE